MNPAIYDKRFSPMAASRNATRVLCGTVWTSQTLLARELQAARAAEKADGWKRVFFVTAEEVGRENPKYHQFVDGEIARLGRQHPFVKTQFFCEEIDAQISMFNPGRLALMQGDQPDRDLPTPGETYAFLIDVAGQDEARMSVDGEGPLNHPGRDSISLSIVSVDLSTLETLQAPTYRVLSRKQWTGFNHLSVFGQVKALGDVWKPQHFVVDATGVGEGFWALLDRSFPKRVIPVKFSQAVKSEIGWKFLALIETGRFRACSFPEAVRQQYIACNSEILPGPTHTLRWGVPEGRRAPDGGLVHDDYLMADALVVKLDELLWRLPSRSAIFYPPFDPLKEMEKDY